MVRSAFRGWVRLGLLLAATAGAAQTFDVNGQAPSNPPPSKKSKAQPPKSSETGMGWGSNIEVAREARATQTALQQGDTRGATEHAQRAVKAAPQNSDLWFTLAYAARLNGQYFLSLDAYKHGLAIKRSVEGLSGLAQTYARMGRSDDAQQTLQEVLEANPKSAMDLQLAGELLLTSDPKQALDFLRRSEQARSQPRTELLMARAYQRLGDGDSAHKMLEAARRSAPNNPEVLRAVASYYRDTGQYKEAVDILEGLHAKDVATLAELGYSYTLAGRPKDAARVYAIAAKGAPRDIEIQLNAAQAMINAQELDQASALLKQAASLKPDHYRMFALRGRLDAVERRNDDAIRDYEAALQHLPPEVPEGVLYPISLRVDLTQVYRDTGDNTNADRVIKDATTEISAINVTGPTRPEFLRLRAATEVAAGNDDSAEKDLKEALQIEPHNAVLMLNYANLLWKTNRQEEARKTYQEALTIDPSSAGALGALGFISRELGDSEAARKYFEEFEKRHPDQYEPYLALGDLFSSNRQYSEAQQSYEQAFQRSHSNALIVAGAMNAALESHHPALAKDWLARASDNMRQNPQVMREHERYLTMTGDYAASAEVGYQVIQKLPKDREAIDYLAYDLLFLKRLDEAMTIVDRFEPTLPDDRDLPLIAGYVHANYGDHAAAVRDFTRALEIEPTMAVGYMNRGYVYNDMRLASKAEQDFRKALAINPQYGEAHLGLAYALLQLRRSTAALKEAEIATKLLPESESLHLVKAEGYRQRSKLAAAEGEYRSALKLNPNTTTTYIALADVQYRGRKFAASVATLRTALTVSPDDGMILAQLGRSYARLHQAIEALKAIESAERLGGKDYKVLLVAADGLRILGRKDQAMTVYERALEGSDENRLVVRLALARLFAEEGKHSDAQQQVALGFAEARVASTDVTSADDYLNAGEIMLSIHQYPLAQRMYGRAQALGADETAVAVGLANVALATGETRSAELQLASIPADVDRNSNYDYQLAQGNVYRQHGRNDLALSSFALANQLDPEDPGTRMAEMELAEDQGRPITDHVSMGSGVRENALFEDENIYQMDARLRGVLNTATLLPPPRRSIETFADSRFLYLPGGSLPPIRCFVAERNAEGSLSFPSELLIQNRNTWDTIFNASAGPIWEIGNVKLSFMPGLQYTIRRDTEAPGPMDQDLFRQFVYVSSSAIANWVSFSGDLIREAGPFTDQNLHSRDFSGAIDFRVGQPWSKNALLVGYNARDLQFGPSIHEYYQTVSYAGWEQGFGTHLRVSAVAEFLRAWRVEGSLYTIAQTLRPRFSVDSQFKDHWTLSVQGAWSSGRDFHAYDNVTTGFMVSYTRERLSERAIGSETATVTYPMRFSLGMQEQSFYDFPGHAHTQVVPSAQVTF